jgi:hypothetical protein
MSELPQPDVMDSTGRMRRLVIALLLGAAAAAAAYFVTKQMAEPDTLVAQGRYSRGAYKFVYYMTALFGALVFAAALAIQNRIAKKKWREELVAKARTVKE